MVTVYNSTVNFWTFMQVHNYGTTKKNLHFLKKVIYMRHILDVNSYNKDD